MILYISILISNRQNKDTKLAMNSLLVLLVILSVGLVKSQHDVQLGLSWNVPYYIFATTIPNIDSAMFFNDDPMRNITIGIFGEIQSFSLVGVGYTFSDQFDLLFSYENNGWFAMVILWSDFHTVKHQCGPLNNIPYCESGQVQCSWGHGFMVDFNITSC